MASSALPTQNTPSQTGWMSNPTFSVLVPYLAAILAQGLLLLLYLKELWSYKPHYQFIPFAIGIVLFLASTRWPRDSRMPFHRSLLSDILLVGGILVGLGNCLFLEPWFAAISCLLLTASLFARTFDAQTGKSLIALSLPLAVCVVPPLNGDTKIITWLQRVSAHFTSQLLDVVGYGHHMPGTVVLAPGTKGFGIEEACSGVQSFFTLLFVAIVFSVWNRRPWFRSLLLMLSTVFWAVLMNTIRIFAIPIAERSAGLDLSTGVSHMLLGYFTLLVGVLLLFSTDQFLLFLFGPVDQDATREVGLGRFVSRGWNRVIAGEQGDTEEKNVRRKISSMTRYAILSVGGLMILAGALQSVDVFRSLFSDDGKQVRFFESIITHPCAKEDLPEEIGGWELSTDKPFVTQDRAHGSDLGLHSDTWNYLSPREYSVVVSMDQTFPGWHELTVCYVNQGWKLDSREWNEDASGEWPYIEAKFSKNTGEKAFLVFSIFDVFGSAYEPPKSWGKLEYYLSGIRNRLSHRIRAQLFRAETFQTQAFVPTFGELSEKQQKQITQNYLQLREQLRTEFMKRRGQAVSDDG